MHGRVTLIFSNFKRTDSSPKLNSESLYDFYDRSSRADVSHVRDEMQRLCVQFPTPAEIESRFQSRDDQQFRSAEFEILIYDALVRNGFSAQVHPSIAGTSRTPDFLVSAPGGEHFYLEATLANEKREEETEHPLVATTLDVFSKNTHKNFCVIVKTTGVPATQPNQRALLRYVNEWLDSFDPDEIMQREFTAYPETTWRSGDLELVITAIPLKPDRRGKSSQMLGAFQGDAGWVDPVSGIRTSIRKKGMAYGELDLPFVIAVNVEGKFVHESDEVSALFGSEVIKYEVESKRAWVDRAQDGAWLGVGGPILRRVSGAWIFNCLHVHNYGRSNPTLYLNPWANQPAPDALKVFPHMLAIDGYLKPRTDPVTELARL